MESKSGKTNHNGYSQNGFANRSLSVFRPWLSSLSSVCLSSFYNIERERYTWGGRAYQRESVGYFLRTQRECRSQRESDGMQIVRIRQILTDHPVSLNVVRVLILYPLSLASLILCYGVPVSRASVA